MLIRTELWHTIQNKEIFRGTLKNKTISGEAYFVDTTIIPLLDIDGSIKEYLAVRYDVTDVIQSRGSRSSNLVWRRII